MSPRWETGAELLQFLSSKETVEAEECALLGEKVGVVTGVSVLGFGGVSVLGIRCVGVPGGLRRTVAKRVCVDISPLLLSVVVVLVGVLRASSKVDTVFLWKGPL